MSVLLTGVAVLAGLVGAGGHISASEKNAEAEKIVKEAKDNYEEAKNKLENTKNDMEQSLLNLGYLKKDVLDDSVKTFVTAYERIKDIELVESRGFDEIRDLSIDSNGVSELGHMADIYSSTISGAAAGAAAGYIMALAASGSLSLVTGGLSVAGSALAMGEIGLAAGIAGSALSIGATLSPVGMIAAPVILFTGFSADSKAEENLESAKVDRARVNKAIEEMELTKSLCNGITERSEMFYKLLQELNGYFEDCVKMLDTTTKKIVERSGNGENIRDNIKKEELELIAVTRSLVGAIKAIIDTPIISDKGQITAESLTIWRDTNKRLPDLQEATNKAKKDIALVACPKCGNRISPRAKKCPKCGNEISKSINSTENKSISMSSVHIDNDNSASMKQLVVCPNCGKRISPRARNCPKCKNAIS